MIERVVVPVDFSAESDRSLRIAPVISGWAGADIELVTVIEPSRRASVEPRLGAAAERLGDRTAWRIVESGGPPEAALLSELHAGRKELWCVGSHARGRFSELFVRSLSENLVRDAHMPVVVVGPRCIEPPAGRVLLVAVDGTDQAEDILPAAAELAVALSLTPRLLQVAGPGAEELPADSVETGYVAHVAGKISSITGEYVDYDVLHGGDAAHSMAAYVARSDDVGMIALATRGLSGGARIIQGSTGFELAHRATVPGLILHQLHT